MKGLNLRVMSAWERRAPYRSTGGKSGHSKPSPRFSAQAAVLLGRVLSLDSNRESSSVVECNSPDSQIFFFFKTSHNTKIVIWRVVRKSQCDFPKISQTSSQIFRWGEIIGLIKKTEWNTHIWPNEEKHRVLWGQDSSVPWDILCVGAPDENL